MARGQFRGNPSPGTAWKERAEELEKQLEEAELERDELQNRLAEIADIAAPERAQADERIDWLVGAVKLLLEERQLSAPVIEMPAPPADSGESGRGEDTPA